MAIDTELLQHELEQLSRQQRALFAARTRARMLPLLASQNNGLFSQRENDKDKYFVDAQLGLSVLYAIAYVEEQWCQYSVSEAGYRTPKNRDKFMKEMLLKCDVATASAYFYETQAAYSAAYADIHWGGEIVPALYQEYATAVKAAARTAAIEAAEATEAYAIIDIELSNEFYISEVKSLANGECLPLWHVSVPIKWEELVESYLDHLHVRKLDYWANEYSGWIKNEFNLNHLRHCAQMPNFIVQGSVAAQLQYLSSVEFAYFGETRILYLGEASAGKTSLIHCLNDEEINTNEAATPRVEIRTRKLFHSNGKIMRVHDWDFGGQVLMHAMHQFFLSENVVYVIVADMRREESVEYWLEYARVFGRGAPTLVLLNKVDLLPHGEQTPLKFDPEAVKRRYPFVIDFIKISCAERTNLDEVRELIDQLCWRQQVLSGETPKSWFEVKELVQAENQDHISFDKFIELCSQCQLPETDVNPTISALTQLGAALYYPEIGAKVVLNPEWMTKAIYYAINAAETAGLKYLTPNSLANLYHQAHQEQKLDLSVDKADAKFLLRLMQQFELAFIDRTHPGSYYLPMVAPVAVPTGAYYFGFGGYFRFRLEFLPPALFYRFITRCGAEVISGKLWRMGAQLLGAGAIVQVEYQQRNNCILLRTRPGENGDFIETLRTRLYELLGESYKEIDYQVEYHRADGHIFLWTQVLSCLERGDDAVMDIRGNMVEWSEADNLPTFVRMRGQEARLKNVQQELAQLTSRGSAPVISNYNLVQGGNAQAHGGTANAYAHAEAQASAEVNIEIQLSELGTELKELGRDIKRAQYDNPSPDLQQIQRLLGEIEYMREDIKEAKGKKPSANLKRSLQLGWEKIQQAAKGIEKIDRVAKALNRVRESINTIPWENFTGVF